MAGVLPNGLMVRRSVPATDVCVVREAGADYRRQLPLGVASEPKVLRRERPAGRRSLVVAGLFAGIGGIELGMRAAGHEARLLCEIDLAARAVLKERFPEVERRTDICQLQDVGARISAICAGFPCQDLSQAGLTAGIMGKRSGLVSEVFRLLDRRDVPWVVLENVPFMLRLGRGRALEVIVSALEERGYKWAYRVVDALAFGLPQRRLRVYLVASLHADPREVLFADEATEPSCVVSHRKVACGFYWTEGIRGLGWAIDAVPTLKGGSSVGVASPPAVLLPDGRIVTPSIQDAERLQGFERDWTLPAEKVAKRGWRWKLVGNAVSVPVATWLGERLAEPGDVLLRNERELQKGEAWPNAAFNVGEGRFANDLSTRPKSEPRQSLRAFLDPAPPLLSRRATAGFFARTARASLRFPPGFLPAVEAHLRRMESLE